MLHPETANYYVVGHFYGGLVCVGVSLWWLINIAYRQHSAEYTQIPYEASSSFPVLFLGSRVKKWPIDSYFRILIFIVGSFADASWDGWADGIYEIFGNVHVLMYGVFAVSGVLEIARYHGLPLPANIEHLITAATFLVQGMLMFTHAMRHPVDLVAHNAWGILATLEGAVIVTEVVYRHNYLLSFLRGYLLLFTGTWIWNTGYITDDENRNEESWTDGDKDLKVRIALSFFVWHGVGDLFISLLVAGIVFMFVKCRRQRLIAESQISTNADHGSIDSKTPLIGNRN